MKRRKTKHYGLSLCFFSFFFFSLSLFLLFNVCGDLSEKATGTRRSECSGPSERDYENAHRKEYPFESKLVAPRPSGEKINDDDDHYGDDAFFRNCVSFLLALCWRSKHIGVVSTSISLASGEGRVTRRFDQHRHRRQPQCSNPRGANHPQYINENRPTWSWRYNESQYPKKKTNVFEKKRSRTSLPVRDEQIAWN
jgi:hypothetical protein